MTGISSFKKIIHAGVLVSFGRLIAVFSNFVAGVLVIRLVARSEFGIIALGNTLINVIVVIAVLGFRVGLPRFIAKYQTRESNVAVGGIIGTALVISLISGVIFSLLFYVESFHVALGFNKPGLQPVLQTFALMILPLVLMAALTGIFRGFENARTKVIFEDLTSNFLKVLLLLLAAFASFEFKQILWIYVVSIWAAFIMYTFYAAPRLLSEYRPTLSTQVGKDLISFSMPLMAIGMMGNITTWASTLIIGILQPADEVGLFNAPLALANVIPVPLGAMLFLYLPLATKLFGQGALTDLKMLYITITKWAYLITLPLLLYFLLDAEFIVVYLFGVEYQDAANVLRVLAFGFSIHTFLGPNATTLISHGDTRAVFQGTAIAAILTVLLCLILVPRYAAFGAAVGTAVAKSVSNIYISVALYLRVGVHPFFGQYIKPVIFSIASSLTFYMLLDMGNVSQPVVHLLLLLMCVLFALIAPLVTRTMNPADVEVIGAIERRLRGKTKVTSWIEEAFTPRDGNASGRSKLASSLDRNDERHK